MPELKALIFDVDGTLANSMPLHYEAWLSVSKEFNFPFPEEMFFELAGKSTYNIVDIINDRYNLNLEAELVVQKKDKVLLEKIDLIQPINAVVDIVHKYYGKIPMAAGTGGRHLIVEKTLKTIGVEKYLPVVVCAEDVENHKPAPDTFLKCAELLGVEPEYCQVFEDGNLGIQAGKNAGMITTDIKPYILD